MKVFLQKNLVLVLAFASPIALILIIALSAHVSSLLISTKYNFIYTTCANGTNYYSSSCNNNLRDRYSVNKGKIVQNPINPTRDSDRTRIFYHDTDVNESKEISFEEAQALSLNELLTSPDGVTVSNNYDRGTNVLFFVNTDSSYGYYLTKNKNRSKLNLINEDTSYSYRNNFHFLGWVLPSRN